MSEAPQTRRELRELERKGLITPPALPTDVPAQIAAVPAITEGFPTRRQLRHLERTGQATVLAIQAPAPEPAPLEIEAPLVEPELVASETSAEQVSAVETATAQPSVEEPQFIDTYSSPVDENTDAEQDGLFEVSPKLVADTQTNSIIIEQVPDIINMSHILETGEILTTGAIELPMLATTTGEMAVVLDAELADEALASEAATGFVSTIAPIRATGVANFGADIGIVPKKMRLGEGQLYLALTISVGLVAVGALILAAYMLKLV